MTALANRRQPALFRRYLAVGVAATAAHWLLLVALVEGAGAAAWAASAAGAVLGAQLAFCGNRWFTFGNRGAPGAAWWPQWWKFMATAALGGGVGTGLVALGVALGVHYLLAQALATALAVGLTFAVNRRWSFAA